MKKVLTVLLVMMFVLGLMGGAVVAEDELPNWNIEGEWEGWSWSESNTFTLTIDEQDAYGNFTGTSEYGPDDDRPVVGKVSGDKVEFMLDSSSYTSLMVGDITATKMVGTFQDTGGNKDEDAVWDWEANGEARWIEYYKAAPAVAAKLLKDAGIDARYGSGRTGGNHIADVAHYMGETTDFGGESKCDVFAYKYAVAEFLNTKEIPAVVAYPVSELLSVVYDGDGDAFGTEAGETLTLTFSNDVFFDGEDQVDAETYVRFDDANRLGHSTDHMEYVAESNTVVITSLQGFNDPRPEIGDYVVALEGMVDAVGNSVVVPDGGVEVTQ